MREVNGKRVPQIMDPEAAPTVEKKANFLLTEDGEVHFPETDHLQ
jgi:hypothetical protein